DPLPRGAGGGRTEHDLVAVLEERPGLAADVERLLPAPGQLEERTALLTSRAGDRARSEEVAGTQAGTVHGHVRELLRRGPVLRGERRAGHQMAVQPDLDGQVEAPVLLGAPVLERLGVLRGRRAAACAGWTAGRPACGTRPPCPPGRGSRSADASSSAAGPRRRAGRSCRR